MNKFFIKPIAILLLFGVFIIIKIKFSSLFLSDIYMENDNIINYSCFFTLALITKYSIKFLTLKLDNFNFYKKIILHFFLAFSILCLRYFWYDLKYDSVPSFNINWIFNFNTTYYFTFLFLEIFFIMEKYLMKNVEDSDNHILKYKNLKKATLDDLDIITPLFDQYMIFYKKESNIKKHKAYLEARLQNNEATIFIAFDGENQAIGFTLIYTTFSSVRLSKILILNDLYVFNEKRNKGTGEKLILQTMAYAKETGADLVRLRTAKDNEIAQGLYHKMKFVRDEQFFTYDLSI